MLDVYVSLVVSPLYKGFCAYFNLGEKWKLVLSGLTDLQTKIFRFANSVNIAKAVTSVLTDLIITVGYFLHRNCMRLQILIMKISCLDPLQWLNNCVGRKNYFTFLALMTTSLLWVCKVTLCIIQPLIIQYLLNYFIFCIVACHWNWSRHCCSCYMLHQQEFRENYSRQAWEWLTSSCLCYHCRKF